MTFLRGGRCVRGDHYERSKMLAVMNVVGGVIAGSGYYDKVAVMIGPP